MRVVSTRAHIDYPPVLRDEAKPHYLRTKYVVLNP
jgi:hypothetical protein